MTRHESDAEKVDGADLLPSQHDDIPHHEDEFSIFDAFCLRTGNTALYRMAMQRQNSSGAKTGA